MGRMVPRAVDGAAGRVRERRDRQAPGGEQRLDHPQVGDRVLGLDRQRRAVEDRGGERARPRTAYGSAVSNVSVSVAGATGGSPPAVTKIRVGRSGGMLNGISIEIRPSVP